MARRLGKAVGVNIKLPKAAYLVLKGIAQENDVSVKFVVKRAIFEVMNSRRIPGLDSLSPVMTYDGESQATVQDGRKLPVHPSV